MSRQSFSSYNSPTCMIPLGILFLSNRGLYFSSRQNSHQITAFSRTHFTRRNRRQSEHGCLLKYNLIRVLIYRVLIASDIPNFTQNFYRNAVFSVFCYMTNNIQTKLLNSDWLRALQFKYNTSANYTSKFQIMTNNWKDNRKFSKPKISRKIMTKSLRGTSSGKSLVQINSKLNSKQYDYLY